jgi:hypothetical protein
MDGGHPLVRRLFALWLVILSSSPCTLPFATYDAADTLDSTAVVFSDAGNKLKTSTKVLPVPEAAMRTAEVFAFGDPTSSRLDARQPSALPLFRVLRI